MKKLLTKKDIQWMNLAGTGIALLLFSIAVGFIIYNGYIATFRFNVEEVEKDFLNQNKSKLIQDVTSLVLKMDARRKNTEDILKKDLAVHTEIILKFTQSVDMRAISDSEKENYKEIFYSSYYSSLKGSFFFLVINASGEIIFAPDSIKSIASGLEKKDGMFSFRKVPYSRGFHPDALIYSRKMNNDQYLFYGGYLFQKEKEVKSAILDILKKSDSYYLEKNTYFTLYELIKSDNQWKLEEIISSANIGGKIEKFPLVNNQIKKEILASLKNHSSQKIYQGGFFVQHSFPDNGGRKAVEAYYYYYKPWNWVISRGIFLEENKMDLSNEKQFLSEKFIEESRKNFLALGVAFFLVIIIAYLFSRKIGTIFSYYNDLVQEQNRNLKKKNESLTTEFKIRERMEMALKGNEELYHSTIDSLTDYILVINENYKIILTNQEFDGFILNAFNVKKCQGEHLLSLHPFFKSMEKAIDIVSTKGIIYISEEIHQKDSFSLDYEIKVIPLSSQDASLKRFIIILRDLTEARRNERENKQMEVKMLAQSKMATLGEMATSIAHEIYQPLNFIAGFIQLLELDVQSNQIDQNGVMEMIQRTHRSIRRITDIIDHLRIFGRADQISKKPVPLKDVVDNTLILLQERIRLRSINLSISIPENLPAILGNETQMEQILINLFQNSLDAFEEVENREKNISLVAESYFLGEMTWIKIIFEDNAGGMAEEVKKRAFEPFFTTKEPGKGTGLGMAIIYGIISEHQGKISIDSRQGYGTSFIMELPSADG